MDAVARNIPTRIALGGQTIPLWVLALLILLVELAFCLLVFAIMRHRELFLWIVACFVIAITWLVYRKFTHGSRDWDRTPHLELRDGRIKFVPSRRMDFAGCTANEMSFPVGSRLEYHVEISDGYLRGDHAQVMGGSLWVKPPVGMKRQLVDCGGHLNVRTAQANVSNSGITFTVIKVYDGMEGEHTETDVTADYVRDSAKARSVMPINIVVGTSSLWLGAIAGALFHNTGYVIAIGILGYTAVAITAAAIGRKTGKRIPLIGLATVIPTYGAGYAAMAVIARYLTHP
jgi:hypothetical protein